MRFTFFLSAFLFVSSFNALNAQAQVPTKPFCIDANCSRANTQFRIDANEDFKLAPTQGYDLKSLNIFWDVDPITAHLAGTITYYFNALQSLDTFYLDCSDSLNVNSILYHGVDIVSNAALHENILSITLPATIPTNAFDSVTISYEGFPANANHRSFTQSSHNNDSIIATLSEPYGSSDWWPSKVSLSDKIDSVYIKVLVPQNYKVGSNGLLVNTDLSMPPFKIYHWKTRYPVASYLIAIACYPYEEVLQQIDLGTDTLLVQHYIYPDSHDELQNAMLQLDSMMKLYSDLFGMYPFVKEKYGHAEWNINGGMEHQTMSFMVNFNFELMAHELAHQWFGDKITCGSWSDIWLNEGFATYAAGLAYENLEGGIWWMPFKETIRGALRDSSNSVFCTDTSDVARIFDGRLSYQKGAYVLHMLRYTMGDEAFFAGLKSYATDTTLSYSFARAKDFKQRMEEFHGASLDEFFNDWYYGKGHPNLNMYWGQRGDDVKCIVQQSYFADNDNGFVFDMNVPVVFYGNNVDSTIVLPIHALTSSRTFKLPFAVDSVKIDPELWWLIQRKITERRDVVLNENDLVVVPNPVKDFLNITSTNPENNIESIDVFSSDGKRLLYHDQSYAPLEIVSLNVKNLASGLYILQVKTRVGAKLISKIAVMP